MKAYDPQGEYTPDEVRDALAGVNNTRELTYRYERLDRHGNYIEDIDYVQSCTIENNHLADIKRTAKFDMLDTGGFNFLQDRIKPYVRLSMPKDGNYYDRVRTLAPAVWWRLDEPSTGYGAVQSTTVGNANNYISRELAYPVTLRPSGVTKIIADTFTPDPGTSSTSTNRSAFWLTFESKYITPLKISLTPSGNGNTGSYNIYYSATPDGQLTLVESGTVQNTSTNPPVEYINDNPLRGYYFIELTKVPNAATSETIRHTISLSRTVVINDSAGNKAHGYADNLNLGGQRLIKSLGAITDNEDSTNIFNGFISGFSSLVDPYDEEPRRAYLLQSGQGLGNVRWIARPGDNFYIEYIAKSINGSGPGIPQLNAGIWVTNNANGAGPGWESAVYNGGLSKVEQLENGWAKYITTPYVDPLWDGVSGAQLAFRIEANSSGRTTQDWLVDYDSVKFIRRDNDGLSNGEIDKSVMIVSGKDQVWSTKDVNLPMDGGLTVNFWQSLSTPDASFEWTSRHYISELGYIEMTMQHSSGSSVVFVSVIIHSTDIYNPYTYQSYGNVRAGLFNSGPHMITFRLDPDGNKASLYVDSSLADVLDTSQGTISQTTNMFLPSSIIDQITVDFSTAGGSSNFVDDYTIYTRPIELEGLRELAEYGRSSRPIRRGFIEWPQGVFVLSAPSRTMADGSSVVRNVEAYDQLLVLKEDAFPERYSIQAGKKYTEAINDILYSTTQIETVDNQSEYISRSDNVSSTETGDTVSFGTSGGSIIMVNDSVPLEGSHVSGKMPSNVDFKIGYLTKDNTLGSYNTNLDTTDGFNFYWNKTGSILSVKSELNAGSEYGPQTNYTPSVHTYLRIIEQDGSILAQYSANGISWTTYVSYSYRGVQNNYPAGITEGTSVYMGATTTGLSVMTNFYLDGVIAPKSIVEDDPATLSTTLEWEPGTPKLKVINDLLSAINYESATYDEDGIFVSKPYVSPTLRPSEFTYVTNAKSIISGDVNQTIDLFNVPNSWVLIVSEPEKPPMVAKYTNNDPNSITSTVERGRTIVDVRTENDAASQAVLNEKVMRLATEASQIYEHIEFTTGIMPIHQNSDVYTLVIDGLVINDKYSETSWSMELSNGALMRHKVRRSVAL